jgi:hypothetical protein
VLLLLLWGRGRWRNEIREGGVVSNYYFNLNYEFPAENGAEFCETTTPLFLLGVKI